jgi:putative membrane protein
MKNSGWLYLLFAGAIMIQSCGDNQKAKNYNDKTLVDGEGLHFIKQANDAGLTEIKAARVAENNSQNPRVISFAKMMVADHMQVGDELARLASNKLVDDPDTPSIAHQAAIDSLSKLSAGEFDHAYMQMMVKDHEQAVDLFTETTGNKNVAVRNFARKILPTLKMHLDSAKAIYASLK